MASKAKKSAKISKAKVSKAKTSKAKPSKAKANSAKTSMSRPMLYGIGIVLLIALILGASAIANRWGQPSKGNLTTAASMTSISTLNLTCTTYKCENPAYNSSTGIINVGLTQSTGYNWTRVSVRFVQAGTPYSNGVPVISWSPPQAVSVNGTWLSNATEHVAIPTAYGTTALGTNLTGEIWAKYQLNIGGSVYYANISSAVITVKHV